MLSRPFHREVSRRGAPGARDLVLGGLLAALTLWASPTLGAPGSVVLDTPPAMRAPEGDALASPALQRLRRRFRDALQAHLSGRLPESRALFEALLPDYPIMASPIRRHVALIHAAEGHYDQSLAWADALLIGEGINPAALRTPGGGFDLYFGSEVAWGLVLRGEALLRLGRPEAAAESLGASLTLSGRGVPALARRHLMLARALERQGDGPGAFAEYVKAGEADPGGPFGRLAEEALRALPARSGADLQAVEERIILEGVEALLSEGEYRRAEQRAAGALREIQGATNRRDLAYLLGRARAGQGEIPEATAALEALTQTPDLREDQYWAVVASLAELRRQARDPAGQLDIVQRFLRTFPQGARGAEARMSLASIYLDQGRQQEAEGLYAEVARLFPEDDAADEARWFLAWSRFEQGDTAGAYSHLRAHALTVVPGTLADARALYWLARAAEAEGRPGLAWWLMADVARRFPDSYYGTMAAWRSSGGTPSGHLPQPLGTPPNRVPIPRRVAVSDGGPIDVDDAPWEIARELLFPGFVSLLGGVSDGAAARSLARAMELTLAGLMPGAYTALSDARSNPRAGPRGLLLLAAFYHSFGQLQRGVRLAHDHLHRAAAPPVFGPRGRPHALAYPVPFLDLFLREGFRQGVDPAVLLGMAQQESGFWPSARSIANARGLLQLIPRTALAMAQKEGIPAPNASTLYRPSINVRLGAAYLRSMLSHFGGNLPRALAAYNAGPGAVDRWLRRLGRDVPDDVFIEEIPYNETRDYVRVVLRNAGGYGALYPNLRLDGDVVAAAEVLPRYDGRGEPDPPPPRAREEAPRARPRAPGPASAPAEVKASDLPQEGATPTEPPEDPDEPGGLVGPGGIFDWE